MRALRRWVDPLIVGILVALILGLLVPVPSSVRGGVDIAGDVAVFLLFLVYGARLSTRAVLRGLRNVRLQGGMLAATFVAFPLIGIAVSWAAEPFTGHQVAAGVLFLSLLPSTVQSSVAFVGVARGDVSGAICGATLSNILGLVLTPVLVLALMGATGTGGFGGLRSVLLQLLLPFTLGQLAQPFVGAWLRAHLPVTRLVDRGTIILIVFGAVASATATGVWSSVPPLAIVALLVLSSVILGAILAVTWWGGRALRLPFEQRIALLMCGSTKSLATGLPLAVVLFPAATAATIVVPVIVFHQMQLVLCAYLARRLAARTI